jgi:hypothetical protein
MNKWLKTFKLNCDISNEQLDFIIENNIYYPIYQDCEYLWFWQIPKYNYHQIIYLEYFFKMWNNPNKQLIINYYEEEKMKIKYKNHDIYEKYYEKFKLKTRRLTAYFKKKNDSKIK